MWKPAYTIMATVLFLLAVGCRSGGDTREGNEGRKVDAERPADNPWGFFPYSRPIETQEGEPPTCDVHDVKMIKRDVKVFRGEFPLDDEYTKTMLKDFPNCDDPVVDADPHDTELFVAKYVCPVCCEKRDAYVKARYGK